MKIGKDAAAVALRSRHAAIVQPVGPCLGARTFRRQLKRRLRGAVVNDAKHNYYTYYSLAHGVYSTAARWFQ